MVDTTILPNKRHNALKVADEIIDPPYINPLHKYRSWSYHHVLIACDTTAVAEKLAQSSEFNDFIRKVPGDDNTNEEPLKKWNAQKFGTEGNFVILINGMTDAQFVIKKVTWFSSVAASTGNTGYKYSSSALQGTMSISEPRGIKFLNVLTHISNVLETSAIGITWILKTIFVGWRDDFNIKDGFPEPMTNIKPLFLTLLSIKGKFTENGGTYDVEFVGQNNGITKQPHLSKAPISKAKLNFKNSPSLKSAIEDKLQGHIRSFYDKHFDKIVAEIQAQNSDFVGRKVLYRLEVDDIYKSDNYLVDKFSEMSKDSGATAESGFIDLSSLNSIESAMMSIAERCSLIQQEGLGIFPSPNLSEVNDDTLNTNSARRGKTGKESPKTQSVKYQPKVVSTLRSTTTEIEICYKLRRTLIPDQNLVSTAVLTNSNPQGNSKLIRDNLIVLNYLYTGKNLDILNLEMDMNNAFMFYQIMTSTSSLIENRDQSSKPNAGQPDIPNYAIRPSNVNPNRDTGQINKFDPIFLSSIASKEKQGPTQNSGGEQETRDFNVALNRWAANEALAPSVTILGNPALLNSTNLLPSEILDDNYDPDTTKEINTFPFWDRFPGFVKINIRMPSDDNDENFSEPFWYQGYYLLLGIHHIFDGGEFKQTLELVIQPEESNLLEQQKKDGDINQEKIKSASEGGVVQTNPPSEANKTAEQMTPAEILKETRGKVEC